MLTQEECLHVFSYEAETGKLYWRVPGRKRRVGRVAGTYNQGYVNVHVGGKLQRAHRVIWTMHHGPIAASVRIDHVNSIGTDNRLENLRPATQAQNSRNQVRRSNNTSGFKGVSWSKAAGKWESGFCVDGKRRYLGLFACPIAAAHAYDTSVTEVHGGFAKTNAALGLL